MISLDNSGNIQNNDNHEKLGSQTSPTTENSSIIPVFLMNSPKEWTYTMRRSMQEVAPGIFLGPYSSASRSKLQTLQEKGITHIVCVRQDIEAHFIKPNFPNVFKYLELDIADSPTENIIQYFQRVKEFINGGLNSGGRVLVHGNAGISRSAALVLAYVMETYNYSKSEAFALVQQRRFCVNPNEGFLAQLHEYEPIYRARKILKDDDKILTSVPYTKRTLYQMDMERSDDRPDCMDS